MKINHSDGMIFPLYFSLKLEIEYLWKSKSRLLERHTLNDNNLESRSMFFNDCCTCMVEGGVTALRVWELLENKITYKDV